MASITACHAVDRRSIRRDGVSSFCIYSQLSIAAKISKIECVVLEIWCFSFNDQFCPLTRWFAVTGGFFFAFSAPTLVVLHLLYGNLSIASARRIQSSIIESHLYKLHIFVSSWVPLRGGFLYLLLLINFYWSHLIDSTKYEQKSSISLLRFIAFFIILERSR